MKPFTNKLYEVRSFSDKFSFCTDWIKAFYAPFFKFSLLFILPFCIVQGYLLQSVMKLTNATYAANALMSEEMIKVWLCYAVSIVSAFFAYSYFFALIKNTVINNNSLQYATFSNIWKAMKCNMGRLFLSSVIGFLFIAVCCVILVLLAHLSKYTLIASIPAFLATCIALLAFIPRFLLTDDPVIEAFTHSLRLGFKCWWGFFSTTLVMGILITIVQCFAYIPIYINSMIQMFNNSPLLDATGYCACALLTYVSTIVGFFVVLITCVQYGHAVKKIDKEEPLNIDNEIVSRCS